MTKKRALVTGGCGFIGSNLSMQLVKKGYTVTVVDDMSSPRTDLGDFIKNNPEIKIIPACFSSDQVIKKIENKEFDFIFHNAAVPRVGYSVDYPYKTTDINISRTVKLMEACRRNIKRFVFASSSSVYGGADILPTPTTHSKDPKSPYAWQKSAIEDIIKVFCQLYDFDAICLRYFNVFGPGQFGDSAYSTAVSSWCHSINEGLPLRSDGSGEQTRDMCYIDNVVQANINAASSNKRFTGECYNVACEDRVSNNEILKFLKNRFKSIEITKAPARPGDVMHTLADISNTSKDLLYKPSVSFWDGLEKTLSWWKLNY